VPRRPAVTLTTTPLVASLTLVLAVPLRPAASPLLALLVRLVVVPAPVLAVPIVIAVPAIVMVSVPAVPVIPIAVPVPIALVAVPFVALAIVPTAALRPVSVMFFIIPVGTRALLTITATSAGPYDSVFGPYTYEVSSEGASPLAAPGAEAGAGAGTSPLSGTGFMGGVTDIFHVSICF
jgi:hypothetical protein